MKVETTRFGTLEIEPEDRLYFPDGLLGLPHLRQFVLFEHSGGLFQWLQSCDEEDIAFVVIDPAFAVPSHSVKLSKADLELLAVADLDGAEEAGDEVGVCAIVNVCNPADPTVNLLAPLCISTRTRRGAQIVQHHSGYSTKHSLRPGATPSGDRQAA